MRPRVAQPNVFEKLRKIITEDPAWSLCLMHPLTKLCLKNIVKNFEEKQTLEELLPAHRDYVLGRLSTSLPLHITANLIDDPGYWRRCCVQRWDLCDVSQYGHSWKHMFFERHLENLVELFIPDTTPPQTILEVVPLCRDHVRRLDTRNASDTAILHHFDFGVLLHRLSRLEELRLVYGVRDCGINFEWNLFEFTLHDCESLAIALKSCQTLKILRLHQSKVEDERCRMLARHLLDHPALRELDLSHNLIGDRGAQALGKLLTSSRLEVLRLCDNEIGGPGALAIAHALSQGAPLRDLDLRLNRLGDEGGRALGHALRTNGTLRRLHLGANELGEPSATALAQALVQNDTLTSINLSANSLGAGGGKALEEGMSQNISVMECDVRLSEVGEESEASISRVARNNRDRTRLRPAGV
ncbi:hypothetical protein NHX12_025787 [Muraenolepis orangiensis]|uniref:T-complex-associated testis-expressed protein 1 n=1 Tax=Muraenolepis orangiensis TaxID=630683 RepID=A0A9Q0IMQ9_9TELE|nr:hypothetical protein NHX12_025787 [Muraenolepis orangiensis]